MMSLSSAGMGNFEKNWGAELINAHPVLFHSSGLRAALASPNCGAGWRDLLERCCVRIEASLDAKDRFEFQRIKSDYGGLRIYWGGRMSAPVAVRIREAVDLAEARAECTCEICGDEGRLHRHSDRLSTRCARHANGRPVESRPGFENLHLIQVLVAGRVPAVRCARYDRATDTFVDVLASTLGTEE